MQSLESCWNYLRNATCKHVIVSLGGGSYDILSVDPDSLGEYFMKTSPAHVVGVYEPNADFAAIADDAEGLQKTDGGYRGQLNKGEIPTYGRKQLSFNATQRMTRFFGFLNFSIFFKTAATTHTVEG